MDNLWSPLFYLQLSISVRLKLGVIEGASCFSIGNNFIEDFKNSKQHNQGLGNIHGDRNNLAHTSASLTNHEQSSTATSSKN